MRFPLFFPLQGEHTFDILLHPGGAGLLHLVRDVAVHVQRECGGGVAQVPLHGLDVVPGANRGHGIAVTEVRLCQARTCGIL